MCGFVGLLVSREEQGGRILAKDVTQTCATLSALFTMMAKTKPVSQSQNGSVHSHILLLFCCDFQASLGFVCTFVCF